MNPQKVCPLSGMQKGQHGRLLASDSRHDVLSRLFSMGLLPGTDVKVVQVAPLGDPVEVEFRGMRLSLRRADASALMVELTEPV